MHPSHNYFPFEYLPEELHDIITKKINLRDINACVRVSKVWNQVFSSDTIWECPKEQLDIEISFSKSILKNMTKISLLGSMISPLKYLMPIDNKSLVREHLTNEDDKIAKRFPKDIVEARGGMDALRRLPKVKIDDNFRCSKDHFTAPIVLGIYPGKVDSEIRYRQICRHNGYQPYFYQPQLRSCLLLRIRNNEIKKIFYDVLSFRSCETCGHNAFITEVATGDLAEMDFPYVTVVFPIGYLGHFSHFEHLDRLTRLFQSKPVGIIVGKQKDVSTTYLEGAQTTLEGNTTLELC